MTINRERARTKGSPRVLINLRQSERQISCFLRLLNWSPNSKLQSLVSALFCRELKRNSFRSLSLQIGAACASRRCRLDIPSTWTPPSPRQAKTTETTSRGRPTLRGSCYFCLRGRRGCANPPSTPHAALAAAKQGRLRLGGALGGKHGARRPNYWCVWVGRKPDGSLGGGG